MLIALSRNYRAWRSFEGGLVILNNEISPTAKLKVAPSKLIKVFGPPSWHEIIDGCTGTYNFEDTNLDLFKIFDHYETEELINRKKLQRKYPPYSIRNKTETLPSEKEFWASHIDKEFWLATSYLADKDSFLKWFYEKIEKDEDILKKVTEKYGEIKTFNYSDNKEVSRDYILFKYNKLNWD